MRERGGREESAPGVGERAPGMKLESLSSYPGFSTSLLCDLLQGTVPL